MAPRAIGFFAGAAYLRRGARFVYVEHRELARYWLVPLVINGGLLIAGCVLALRERHRVAQAIWAAPLASGWLASLHHVFEFLIAFALLAAVVVAVALCSSLVAAPFNDALSEAVERIERGAEPP